MDEERRPCTATMPAGVGDHVHRCIGEHDAGDHLCACQYWFGGKAVDNR